MLAGQAISSRLHGVIVLSSGTHRDCRNSQPRAKERIRCVPGSWPVHRPHENGVDGLGAVQWPQCSLEAATTPFTMLTATRPISVPNSGQPNQTNLEAKAGTKEVVSMLSAPRVMLPHLQQQQPQQGQQGQPGQQQQQHAIPPPPPPVQVTNPQDLSLAGVLHFLQTEWRRYERDRNEWEIERAEMRVCLQKQPSPSNDTQTRRGLPSSRASDAPSKM